MASMYCSSLVKNVNLPVFIGCIGRHFELKPDCKCSLNVRSEQLEPEVAGIL